MCQCIDVLCVCIHDIYFYLIKKGWRSSFYTSFDLYEYKVHNEAVPQPLMYVEIQIQVLHFPNTARLLCMYNREMRRYVPIRQASSTDSLIVIRDHLGVKQSTQQ